MELSSRPSATRLFYFRLVAKTFIPAWVARQTLADIIRTGHDGDRDRTGYEDLLIRDKRRLALGAFYHQLHHRYYECNYGNQEMPWDRWFDTFHDGSETATLDTRARKKRMYAK